MPGIHREGWDGGVRGVVVIVIQCIQHASYNIEEEDDIDDS